MVLQIDYIKSNLIHSEGTVEDTYLVVIKRTKTDDRVESLENSLKEISSEDTRGL